MSVVATYGLGGTRQLRTVRTTAGRIVVAVHDLALGGRAGIVGSLTLTEGEAETLKSALGDLLEPIPGEASS